MNPCPGPMARCCQYNAFAAAPARRGLAATLARAAALVSLALSLAGCADTAYLLQSIRGHLQVMGAARPVAQWLQDPLTPADLKLRLELAQRMREFAVTQIHLPDNASYRRYADLQRGAVVWNVVAAPPFSLKLQTWCFPVAGCVSYRGYFEQAQAQQQALLLQQQGLEASVYGVPAYSTLGWMNWAGGDPLLSTFIRYPEGELARMVFHELAHQVLYVKDDTQFNESYASAVERLATKIWLSSHGSNAARDEYAALSQRRAQFHALARETRLRLEALYARAPADATATADMAPEKQRALREFAERYAALKAQWGGYAGYDGWVARANNASFGALAAYDELVPGFEALFDQVGQDWPRFYDAVRALTRLPRQARTQALKTQTFPEVQGG